MSSFYDQNTDTRFPNNSSANQVGNQLPRPQTMDNRIKRLMELLSERENNIRNLPNFDYWIHDLYSQINGVKKYDADIDNLKKCNDSLKSEIDRLKKEVQELNEKLSDSIQLLKQDRKDIQELQSKLKDLRVVNKGQVNARQTSSDKSINAIAAEPSRRSEQEALKAIRDKQIGANDAQLGTHRGPISDFCQEYNALFSSSGPQRQKARREYLLRYSVKGASFDENSGALKESDVDRAEYYLYQRATGVYEVVPTDKGKYEQEKHKRRGGESFFESNFDDFDSYSRIKVIAPAVFSADLSLRQKGKLQLS